MLEIIKSKIHQEIDALFAVAAVDEMAGDMEAYEKKANTIATIAAALGIDTSITIVTLRHGLHAETGNSDNPTKQ